MPNPKPNPTKPNPDLLPLPLGDVVMTAAVAHWADTEPTVMRQLIERTHDHHRLGDWGDVCPEDKAENNKSLQRGLRILSVYHVGGRKVWIITEADRSVTTILFPEDY